MRNGGQPFSEQRCLPEAGRSRDERQGRPSPRAQARTQSLTRHQSACPPWDVQLRLEQGIAIATLLPQVASSRLRVHCLRPYLRRDERRVLDQDASLELSQERAGIDSELFDQAITDFTVGPKRFGLAPGPERASMSSSHIRSRAPARPRPLSRARRRRSPPPRPQYDRYRRSGDSEGGPTVLSAG